jgi:REP element-mobilizing transposase RayT
VRETASEGIMVAAYHLIWTIYGVWLPNDPRGSGSQEVRAELLKELGAIHYGRKKIQPASAVIRKFYEQAKPKLKFKITPFDDDEIALVAQVFNEVIRKERYTCYGCAIMPDHVHLVIRKHRDKAEEMIQKLQDATWNPVLQTKNRPSDHPVWGGLGWKVYLDTRADIERTVRYVDLNPEKDGMQPQEWEFVTAYDGWLPGIGAKKP